MTDVSQNGWPIRPTMRRALTVAGVHFGDVRDGDVFTVLQYVATRFHYEVEHLIAGTCGAYNPRKIPGSNTWSNHASATAIDCNWQRHPLGVRGTYTWAQRTDIDKIMGACGGVVRWGGVYTTTVDEMHFEINTGAAGVKSLAAKIIRERQAAAVDWTNPTVQAINFFYSEAYRASIGKAATPYPSSGTPSAQAVKDRQARNAYAFTSHADGVDPEPEVPEAHLKLAGQ
jgi:hypothetical protein